MDGGGRFYGDNLDSILGSDWSEERSIEGTNWYDDDNFDDIPVPAPQEDDYGFHSEVPHEGEHWPHLPSANSSPVFSQVISSPPNVVPNETRDGTGNQGISFSVNHNYHRESQLKDIYPKEMELVFATLAHDLSVVADHHVENAKTRGGKYRSLMSSPSMDGRPPPYSIAYALDDGITHLLHIKEFVVSNLDMYEGECSNQIPATMVAGVDEKPWIRWPCNLKRVPHQTFE